MYKKVIDYKDYLGNKREEEFFFNLTKPEVIKWISGEGDYTLDKVIERLIKTNNRKELFETFERLIYESYGEISLDGRRFIKNDEVKKNFMETEAYAVFFTELVGSTDAVIDFIKGILPDDLLEEVKKIELQNKANQVGLKPV